LFKGGPMTQRYRIGEWTFDPAAFELRRADEVVRIERRAAATLALLCESGGAIVSKRELLSHVWGDRHISEHGVAVVIGDLRKALGDDARQPRFIETVSKGGYRLLAAPRAPVARRSLPRAVLLTGLIGAAAIVAGMAALPLRGHETVVLLEDVRNDTGEARYDTLAAASGGSVLGSLSKHARFRVTRRLGGGADLRLRGRPELLLEAQDLQTGSVAWSVGIFAPEAKFPQAIGRGIDDFDATIGKRT
jgi:DNA-binding winged helix-turn-helix (wHTH) protein